MTIAYRDLPWQPFFKESCPEEFPYQINANHLWLASRMYGKKKKDGNRQSRRVQITIHLDL